MHRREYSSAMKPWNRRIMNEKSTALAEVADEKSKYRKKEAKTPVVGNWTSGGIEGRRDIGRHHIWMAWRLPHTRCVWILENQLLLINKFLVWQQPTQSNVCPPLTLVENSELVEWLYLSWKCTYESYRNGNIARTPVTPWILGAEPLLQNIPWILISQQRWLQSL